MHKAYAILYFNYETFVVTAILSSHPFTESEILTGSVVIIDKKTPHSIDSAPLTSDKLVTLCYEEYVSYSNI